MLLDVLSRLVDMDAPQTTYCDLAVFDDGLVVVPLGRVGGPLAGLGAVAVLAQVTKAGVRRPRYDQPNVRRGSARSFSEATGAGWLEPSRIEMVTVDGAHLRVALTDEVYQFQGMRRQMRPERIEALLQPVLPPGCVVVRPGTLHLRRRRMDGRHKRAPTRGWEPEADQRADSWDDW